MYNDHSTKNNVCTTSRAFQCHSSVDLEERAECFWILPTNPPKHLKWKKTVSLILLPTPTVQLWMRLVLAQTHLGPYKSQETKRGILLQVGHASICPLSLMINKTFKRPHGQTPDKQKAAPEDASRDKYFRMKESFLHRSRSGSRSSSF